MEDVELLGEVKVRLGVTGAYHNDLLMSYIADVKAYMLSAGVKQSVIDGTSSIGCIARGVADLWNYGSGEGVFSKVFYERTIQLALTENPGTVDDVEYVPMTKEEYDALFETL